MKSPKYFFVILLTMFLLSCSGEKQRLKLLEKELLIQIPADTEQIENKTENAGSFDGDFGITIKLRFSENGLRTVVEQIENSEFYNSAETIDYSLHIAKELKAKQQRGLWKYSEGNYQFIDFGTNMEPIEAEINTKTRELDFVFSHL